MIKNIKFRPHHFLCTIGFQGKGYSTNFIRNYQLIHNRLNQSDGDSVMIEVVSGADAICHACPNRLGKACNTEEKIRSLDERHSAAFNFNPGLKISWGDAKKSIAGTISDKIFDCICQGCSWKDLGICRKAFNDLKQNLE